jgi:hypothetical protein
MWSIDDYLDSIEKTINRLKELGKVVQPGDTEIAQEIEREISILGELYDKLTSMNSTITFLTIH